MLALAELNTRRGLGLQPSSAKELWAYMNKKKSPSPRTPPFFFAFMSIYFFTLWESFIRILVQREMPSYYGWIGVFLVLALFAWKWTDYQKKIVHWSPWQFLLLLSGLALSAGSVLGLLLLPWALWRALFIVRSSSSSS